MPALETSLHPPLAMYASDRNPSHFSSKIQSGWLNAGRETRSGMGWRSARKECSQRPLQRSFDDFFGFAFSASPASVLCSTVNPEYSVELDAGFGLLRSAPLPHEALHALVAAGE